MRVLVCDDDPVVGEFLLTMFQHEDWDGCVVADGEACLAHVADGPVPDVLVLDQVMPGLTGTQVAEQLRDRGFDRPILLCSAHIGRELDADIDRLGLHPINKIDVEALVRTAVAAVGAPRHRLPR